MTKKSILVLSLSAVFAISALAYWMGSGDEAIAPDSPAPTRAAVASSAGSDTVASAWQWQHFDNAKSAPGDSQSKQQTATLPFSAVEVYKVLQGIKLDDNGRVVPDQTALKALERGYNDMGAHPSTEAMSELQNIIRVGLPGPAGQEAARIVEDYFRYRAAEADFNAQLSTQLSAHDHYQQLKQLRRSYLGQDVADKLFEVEDAQARHMMAAIDLQRNDKLPPAEKQAQQAALQEQMNDRLLAMGQLSREEAAAEKVQRLREQGASGGDIYSTRRSLLGADSARELAAADQEEAEWQSRFNGFWQARRYVMQAGLTDSERDRQIEQLLGQYFKPEEHERARATSVDWQARDQS